jgi:hypothetical protein
VEFAPPRDLRQRLDVLPQSYLRERRVIEHLKLATTESRGKQELDNARKGTMSWPEAHYLSPLHPALDWAADRALASLGRNQVFAVEGTVDGPSVLLHGTLTNARGQVVSSAFIVATFPNPDNARFAVAEAFSSAREVLVHLGVADQLVNRGSLTDVSELQPYVAPAVEAARKTLGTVVASAEQSTRDRVDRWSERVHRWDTEAGELIQRAELRDRKLRVDQEKEIAAAMLPDQQLVRPLIVVVAAEVGPA